MEFNFRCVLSNLLINVFMLLTAHSVAHAWVVKPTPVETQRARERNIGAEQRDLLRWMQQDLQLYLENFEAFFESKLNRIREHEQQRLMDAAEWLSPLKLRLAEPMDDGLRASLTAEISRLENELKPYGFVSNYSDGNDFVAKFVGEKGRVLKMHPSSEEMEKMNRGGDKLLYVDTWGVPFFNSGTQTRYEAKEGVAQAVRTFQQALTKIEISNELFLELFAVFARPEFDDLRRYKLLMYPKEFNKQRFAGERNDASFLGEWFPAENFLFTNRTLQLDPLSYSFGRAIHILGIISHDTRRVFGDGRIFTGPADFAEHDLAHATFNFSNLIPGTPDEWLKIHKEFFWLRGKELDAGTREIMTLVYFHLTHESGFKAFLPSKDGSSIDPRLRERAKERLIGDIREKIRTRFYYDWIPNLALFDGNYERQLVSAFRKVTHFFEKKISTLLEIDKSRDAHKIDPSDLVYPSSQRLGLVNWSQLGLALGNDRNCTLLLKPQ